MSFGDWTASEVSSLELGGADFVFSDPLKASVSESESELEDPACSFSLMLSTLDLFKLPSGVFDLSSAGVFHPTNQNV